MANNIEETVEELKAENLELKLDGIRKQFNLFKTDMHRHLDLILEQTSKTNGSVARAMEKIAEIEREDTKTKLAELEVKVHNHKLDTNFWTVISKNKFVRWLIYGMFTSLFIQGSTGSSIPDLLKLLLKTF